MPHFWNDILVVTIDELVPAFYKSYNTLKMELYRYKDKPYGIKRAQLGGNGRQALIKFDSLHVDIREALGDPRKLDHCLEQFYKVDPVAVQFYTEYVRPGFGTIETPEAERYIINASMVQAIIQLEHARTQERLARGGSIRATKYVRSVAETLLVDSITFQEVLQAKYNVQHTLPKHPARFRQTLNAFKKDQYISLVKDPYGNSKKNAQKVTDELEQLLTALFATQSHKPSLAEVHQQYEGFLSGYVKVINNNTGEVYDPKQFKKISESTSKNWLKKWENKLPTNAKRSGNRQEFMTKFIPYDRMEQPKFAGSIISIDDRQPPFKYPDGKSGKRMWYYIAIDLASQAITCWVSGETKEGLIMDFYRQLVRNYHQWGVNIPDGLECESSLNSSFKDTFLRPGAMFQNVRIEANNARGKRIERYFGSLRYQIEKSRNGWLARPTAKSESNQLGAQPVPMLSKQEINDNALEDIVTWNNMAHNKHTDVSRWDYFMNNQHPDLKPTNYRAILPHIGYKTETSCNAGMIRLQYGEWLLGNDGQIASGQELISLMKVVEGKDIDIYWLDANDGSIIKALIYQGSKYICEAHPVPFSSRAKIEETEEHREARAIMARYKKTVTEFLKTQVKSIDQVTVIDNRPKTIGTSFSIEGIGGYKPSTDKVEILKTDFDDVPVYIPNQHNERPSLKDRF